MKNYLAYGLVAVIIIAGLFFYIDSEGKKYDGLAKCMSDRGVKMYGAFWCPHCAEQKEIFGNSMEFINYVECSTPDMKSQTQACIDAKIETYPTWDFGEGKRISGIITPQQLASLSGCKV